MDEENKETVVLGAISRGVTKFDKISQETNVEPKAVSYTPLTLPTIYSV